MSRRDRIALLIVAVIVAVSYLATQLADGRFCDVDGAGEAVEAFVDAVARCPAG